MNLSKKCFVFLSVKAQIVPYGLVPNASGMILTSFIYKFSLKYTLPKDLQHKALYFLPWA